MRSHHPFGNILMSKREFCANCSEVQRNRSTRAAAADSEEKSTSCWSEILQQQRVRSCNTFTKLHLVEFIPQEKDLPQSVSRFMLRKTRRQKKPFLNLEHSYFPIAESAASMNSTRWTITLESSCMKLWSSRLFLLQRLELFALLIQERQF